MQVSNQKFDIRGVHHLALVCKDMARTVAFYRDVLGMPLLKTLDLPGGRGQHFFFDMGNGDALAFFWFPEAPEAQPGVANPRALPGDGSFITAHASMNHLAFRVPPEKFDEYVERLRASGVALSKISNHDDSPAQISPTPTADTYSRSVYFFDPDGVCLEFAAATRDYRASDVVHDPVDAEGEKVAGMVTGAGTRA
jgi:catechol 2,3-dioxygenase-like lactoylglutathione lyase family enzyme